MQQQLVLDTACDCDHDAAGRKATALKRTSTAKRVSMTRSYGPPGLMSMSTQPSHADHLWSAIIALCAALALLLAGRDYAIHLENRCIQQLAPLTLPQKDQGIAIQTAAARQRGVLLLYGSSELVRHVADRASDFFRSAPTGFQVSPVGKVGTSPLILAERLASLAPVLRGRKIAVLLSPHWFFAEQADPDAYAGNFSRLQAAEFLFTNHIAPPLRCDLARRMLDFPNTLDGSPLLALAVHQLAEGTFIHRCFFTALLPLGWMDLAILKLQDHFETALFILHHLEKNPPPSSADSPPDWPSLLSQSDAKSPPILDLARLQTGADDQSAKEKNRYAHFAAIVPQSPEWGDLDLLLRVLKGSGAQPLLLGIPISGPLFDRLGISREMRETFYYRRVEAAARASGFPLLDFENHDADLNFLYDRHDHPSYKGWIYLDKALDDFFHHRL